MAARKHGIKTHFPKDRSCEICKRTKIRRAPCRRRIGEAALRAENVGDSTTADHKVREVKLETIIDMLSWYKIQSLNGYNHAHVKQKLLRRRKGVYESFWSRQGNHKSLILTIPSEFCISSEDLSWNHSPSTPHTSESIGIAA